MNKCIDWAKKMLPGIALAIAVAAVARLIGGIKVGENVKGAVHIDAYLGASVIAMFIGMAINTIRKPSKHFAPGLKFTAKKILKFAIILLGASMSVQVILQVGLQSLEVMVFTLLTCFGGGYFIGKALGLNWKLSNLISAGTGICGGSAIAAIAPVIEADDSDIAYALSATFLFDMAMIVLFPYMGHWLGLSDAVYGVWSGTAVNDTSSVVAAGYAYSEAAGDFATMVKLTRTLSIIPTVLVFSFIAIRIKRREAITGGTGSDVRNSVNFAKLFPWFILGFVALALVNSTGIIPKSVSSALKTVSKFLMVAALAAIGMNTSFRDMAKSGIKPMLHGFIISALVVVVAISVEYVVGFDTITENFGGMNKTEVVETVDDIEQTEVGITLTEPET